MITETPEHASSIKRISAIKLHNFRAYYDDYNPIILANGENMLIYGENGSGKSSLFKALNNYFSSSSSQVHFVKNRYLLDHPGEVFITFNDFNLGNLAKIDGSEQTFKFSSLDSNNTAQFIQDASLVKGFLDYTNLLDIYFHHEPQPNLFKLIVLSLLGEHIPISSGGNFKFKNKWAQLQKDLIDKAYTRNDRCHKIALYELPIYETHLRRTLDEIFQELNRYLKTYFKELNIQLSYVLEKMKFNYGDSKYDWKTIADLRLRVIKDEQLIEGDYRDILNEARLSACAICLYLASVKQNPTQINLKLLYLDDIFIGLDTSNRIPILQIIQNEFSEFQIFISTYDRHLYELAKLHFDTFVPRKWQFTELYVVKQKKNDISFDKPLIIQNQNDYSKALYYLHNPIMPDFPASANYFRKFSESILQTHLPSHEIRNQDYSLIGNYRLSNLVNSGIRFYQKINADLTLLLQLKCALPTLLHPLSHFNLSSPIYKRELLEIQYCLDKLEKQLISLKSTYKGFIPQSQVLKLKIPFNENECGYFEIEVYEMIYILLKDGQATLSNGECWAKCTYILTDNIKSKFSQFNSKSSTFKYKSLSDAYDRIYLHVINKSEYQNLTKAPDYKTEFEINNEKNWKCLAPLVVW